MNSVIHNYGKNICQFVTFMCVEKVYVTICKECK